MISLHVIVLDELADDEAQVLLAERNDVPETLLPDGSNEPLRVCVQVRAPRRQTKQLNVRSGQDFFEVPRVERIPVDDEMGKTTKHPIVEVRQVTGHLLEPSAIGAMVLRDGPARCLRCERAASSSR